MWGNTYSTIMEKEDYVTSTASNSEETFSQTYDDDNVSSSWSNLNLQDAEMDSPTIEELIRRNVKLIEARIIRIINWRLQERKKNTRNGLCLGDYLETQEKEEFKVWP